MKGDGSTIPERDLGEIDTSVAHAARVCDYLLGGKANFSVDRTAAERAYAAWPGGLDGVRADARAHRAVLGRIVRYLARDAGIRQFLDIGTGIPGGRNRARRPAAYVVRGGTQSQLSMPPGPDAGIGLPTPMGRYIIGMLSNSVLYILMCGASYAGTGKRRKG